MSVIFFAWCLAAAGSRAGSKRETPPASVLTTRACTSLRPGPSGRLSRVPPRRRDNSLPPLLGPPLRPRTPCRSRPWRSRENGLRLFGVDARRSSTCKSSSHSTNNGSGEPGSQSELIAARLCTDTPDNWECRCGVEGAARQCLSASTSKGITPPAAASPPGTIDAALGTSVVSVRSEGASACWLTHRSVPKSSAVATTSPGEPCTPNETVLASTGNSLSAGQPKSPASGIAMSAVPPLTPTAEIGVTVSVTSSGCAAPVVQVSQPTSNPGMGGTGKAVFSVGSAATVPVPPPASSASNGVTEQSAFSVCDMSISQVSPLTSSASTGGSRPSAAPGHVSAIAQSHGCTRPALASPFAVEASITYFRWRGPLGVCREIQLASILVAKGKQLV